MSVYVIWLIASGVVCAGFFYVLLRKSSAEKGALTLSLVSAVLAAVCGTVVSKLVYVICKISEFLPIEDFSRLLSGRANEFSFFGAGAGVVLGVYLAGRITRGQTKNILNVFAPAGALLCALSRFGEFSLGMLGVGEYTENAAISFFPFTMQNEWNENYLAVFMLEGLMALICLAFSLKVFHREKFLRTVFYLCLPQILCESLRVQCMKWGFVRIEQFLCVVCMVGILVWYILHAPKEKRSFAPLLIAVVCIAVCVGVEFALDKTDWANWFCYLLMILALTGFGFAEHMALGKMKHEKTE